MTEIEMMLNQMNYEEVANYLKSKYGKVAKDYFINDTYKYKTQGITRGKEGLYIHHIDEDKAIMLSTPKWVKLSPFAYQKADRLVYCNLLEHLVLHIKIFECSHFAKNPMMNFGVGGIYNFIVPELNDIYSGIQYQQPWKRKVVAIVLPLKDDYFKCIKRLVNFNFPYPLMNSLNESYGIWKNQNNKDIYQKFKNMGVKN